MPSPFTPKRPYIKTNAQALDEKNYFNLKGLNKYSPDELMDDKESPEARNFRVFDDKSTETRTAISKRYGHRFYSTPVGETDRGSQTSTTGAADRAITVTTWYAQPFTVSQAGNLSKVEVRIKNDNTGTAPLIVKIYSNNGGVPGTLMATTSISNSSISGSYAYLTARTIEAPAVTTATTYFIVSNQQTEGTGDYKWSSTSSATDALVSVNSGNSWSSTSYALNYRVYVSTSGGVLGQTRFYRSTTTPLQVFAHSTNVYSVNDGTGATTSIDSGLSANAEFYRFAGLDDNLYYVNGFDNPRMWDGASAADAGGSPPVSKDVVVHKNRLFLLEPNTNRVVFSDIGDYDTFGSTSFLYIPAPKTADVVVGMIPFQDGLVFLTRNTKYILTGSDLTSFTLREATAKKGCVGIGAFATDDNYIYFVSDDGVYRFNGGTDQLLSQKVDPILDATATKEDINVVIQQNLVRIYYTPTGQTEQHNCLIFDSTYTQWLHDTGVYVSRANRWVSQTDDGEFLVGNSRVGALYYAEDRTSFSDVGKPIDFEYRTKYQSFDHPSRKHRVKRLYPFFYPGEYSYYVDVQIDVDEMNSPLSFPVNIGTSGATWGGGSTWGGGAVWGGGTLEPQRIAIPGQNRKHQIRFVQGGVDNPVYVLGYSVYLKMRRPI